MSKHEERPNPLGVLAALAVMGFIVCSAVSNFWSRQSGDTQTYLINVVCWSGLMGTPLLVVLGLWAKRRADYRRKLATWRWQKIMHTLDATRGLPYLGKPQDRLSQMTWRELELFAAEVFSDMGYATKIVGRSGDQGVDVRMTNPQGQTEVVQCKQWGSPVGEPEVRNLYGSMMHVGAVRAFLFAPQGFTRPARQFAQGKSILLCDQDEISRLVERSNSVR